MIVYYNHKYLPENEVRIAPTDRGFLFADSLYEVIRSYQGRLFEPELHINRLEYGAKSLQLNRTDFGYLRKVAHELIQQNSLTGGQAVVYIQVTRGTAPRTHFFPPKETPLTVYAACSPFSAHIEEIDYGVNVICVPDQRWLRCDIKTTGLLLNAIAQQRAKENDAHEALFVRNGCLTEGTHTNVFAVFDGCVVTPPTSNHILNGVTRRVVTDLCVNLEIPVKMETIFETDLQSAEELFITGTTVEITPVVQINGKNLRDGSPGRITKRLQAAFKKLATVSNL